MEKIHISLRKEQITKNFFVSEFYTASNPDHEFDIDKAFFLAAQIVRDWVCKVMGVDEWPVNVTSTSRPNDTFGFHRTDSAIDLLSAYVSHGKTAPLSPVAVLTKFREQVINYQNGIESALIYDLRSVGINGFGVECACIHLDIRPDKNCDQKDDHGNFMVFEFKMDSTGNILINRSLKGVKFQ